MKQGAKLISPTPSIISAIPGTSSSNTIKREADRGRGNWPATPAKARREPGKLHKLRYARTARTVNDKQAFRSAAHAG